MERLELKGMRVSGYRSLREFPGGEEVLEIGGVTTLIGKNDVGKSNVLRALKKALKNERMSKEDFTFREDTCEIFLYFRVPKTIRDEFSKEFGINSEEVEIRARYRYTKNRPEYFLNGKKSSYSKLRKYLPEVLFVPAVKDIQEELKFGRDTLVSELLLPIIEKTSEEKSRTETVYMLKRKLMDAIEKETSKIREMLKEELRRVWEEVEEVSIEVSELRLEKAFTPQITIKDKFSEKVSIIQRGSGIQRHLFLCLMEIYRKMKIGRGYILIVEEPEIYLHPGAQKRMCSLLREFSREGKVIISTHSTLFVDKSELEYTYLLSKEKGDTKVNQIDGSTLRKILEELEASPSDLLLSDGIILLEGPSDVAILKEFLRAIDWEYNVPMLPIGGSNIESLDPADLHRVNPNVALILDSDLKEGGEISDRKRELKRKFEEGGVKVYFWKKDGGYVRSIENLFDKKSIEEVMGVTIERDIEPYEDVSKLIDSRLKEKYGEGARYHKVKNGRKIAKRMVERKSVPKEVKEILMEISREFGLSV